MPFDNLGDREFQFQKSPSKTSLSDFIIWEEALKKRSLTKF